MSKLNKTFSRSDVLLIALLLAEDNGLTPVRAQKSMFLLQENIKGLLADPFKFIAHNYGPFSHEVYEVLDNLVDQGLVSKENTSHKWKVYKITSLGKIRAEELISQVPKDKLSYFKKLLTWMFNLSFQQLISTVYKFYPAYKVNSIFNQR